MACGPEAEGHEDTSRGVGLVSWPEGCLVREEVVVGRWGWDGLTGCSHVTGRPNAVSHFLAHLSDCLVGQLVRLRIDDPISRPPLG